MKRIFKLLTKKPPVSFTKEELENKTEEFGSLIATGVEKYKKKKENGSNIYRIRKNMFYTLKSN